MIEQGKIVAKHLDVVYNNGACTVKGLNFQVNPNEFLCLIDPSGCGKTTALNVLANFIKNSQEKYYWITNQQTITQNRNRLPTPRFISLENNKK